MRNRFFGLCLPPMLIGILDGSITLVGQPAEYWAGNYSRAVEGNPTFYGMMIISPWAAVALFAIWMGLCVGLILLLPDTLALIVSIAVTLWHSVGAATWLLFHFRCSYQTCDALFLFTAVLLGTCIRCGWQAVPAQPYQVSLKPTRRWVTVAILLAIVLFINFWPYYK
jgi:hypothetical protein